MKFLRTISAAIITLLSTSAIFATPLPDRCPSLEAIKHAGVERIDIDSTGHWSASSLRNKYDTAVEWTFMLLGHHDQYVKDKNEANQLALQALQTLALKEEPQFEGEAGICFYIYGGSSELGGFTMTPPLTP